MISSRRKDRFIIIYLPNLLFFVVLICMIFFTHLVSWPWFLLDESLHSPLRILELSIGQCLNIFACTFIVWGVVSLGLDRAEGKELAKPPESTELVTKGAYAFCRHPITFGFIIGTAGFAFTFDFVPLFLTAAIYPFSLYVILKYEEKELEARFGQAYIKYKESTPIFPVPVRKSSAKSRRKPTPEP